jgi:CrcB protein
METFLLISGGAVLGANLRYWISDFISRRVSTGFPIGTLIINASGSFLLGFLVTLATERLILDSRLRLLFVVGFLGAYTTFSTYTYESVNLILKGELVNGLINLFGSAFLGILSVALGIFLAKLAA